MSRRTAARRRGVRGQSLVEFALVTPVMVALFIGVYAAAGFLTDRQVAGQAARAGVRLGAEFGGTPPANPCQANPIDPCGIDGQMIQQVKTISRGLLDDPSPSDIDEIDIYQPCASPCVGATLCSAAGIPGGFRAGLPLADVYIPDVTKDLDGTTHFKLQGVGSYTLDLRAQAHPREGAVGMRVVYTYHAPVPLFTFFDRQTSEYATMCFAPLETS